MKFERREEWEKRQRIYANGLDLNWDLSTLISPSIECKFCLSKSLLEELQNYSWNCWYLYKLPQKRTYRSIRFSRLQLGEFLLQVFRDSFTSLRFFFFFLVISLSADCDRINLHTVLHVISDGKKNRWVTSRTGRITRNPVHFAVR